MSMKQRIKGAVEELRGQARRRFGSATGDPNAMDRGNSEVAAGQARQGVGKLGEQVKGMGEQLVGRVKGAAGSVTGSTSTQLRGKAQELKGYAREKLNK